MGGCRIFRIRAVKESLGAFFRCFPEALTLLEYVHLKMAEGLVAMSEEEFGKAIKCFEMVLALESEISDKQMISITHFWMARGLRRHGRYKFCGSRSVFGEIAGRNGASDDQQLQRLDELAYAIVSEHQ